jgi:Fe(II)/alpha-ketoglutarate-dependent arginine beta-hydroxylase
MTPAGHHLILLDAPTVASIEDLLAAGVAELPHDIEHPDLQRLAPVLAQELPRALRAALYEFRLQEPAAVCMISGFPVDNITIGPTPRTWREGGRTTATWREALFFYLCATLIGEPVAWATKQDARLMHDIVPQTGDGDQQLASGSTVALTWHTEDGFSEVRADYLGLMCLRNPSRTGTTIGTLDPKQLTEPIAAVLRQARFQILPDGSHFQPISDWIRRSMGEELTTRGRLRLRDLRDNPPRVPLLFGSPAAPYLRLDQHFARAQPADLEAAAAFAALCSQVNRSLTRYVLDPGDICFIDNYRAVHGRDAFRARYDGTDRWLKRLNIVRDLRRSVDYRAAPADRILA